MPRPAKKHKETIGLRIEISREAHNEIVTQQAELSVEKGYGYSKETIISNHFTRLWKARKEAKA